MKKPHQSTYMFDIDDRRELARLGLQDNLFNEIIPRFPPLQFVPHQNTRILDVACGPGGWVLQVAQAFPETSITGVDVSSHMIQYARAQAEARKLDAQFRIMDIRKLPWDFPDEHFNLVNARFVAGCVPVSAWVSFLHECYRVLKPGGVFRNVETVHMSAPTCPLITKLTRLTYSVMYKRGISFSAHDIAVSPMVAKLLRQAGFEDLVTIPYMVDLSYGAPLHDSMGENLRMASNLLKPLIMELEGVPLEEMEELRQGWDREWDSPSFVCHWYLSGISGIKR